MCGAVTFYTFKVKMIVNMISKEDKSIIKYSFPKPPGGSGTTDKLMCFACFSGLCGIATTTRIPKSNIDFLHSISRLIPDWTIIQGISCEREGGGFKNAKYCSDMTVVS